MPDTELKAPAADARLADWLSYQERLHPRAIELGLERVRSVALRLGLLPSTAVTLTVAGTNGKGSSTTLAAGIFSAAGYRTGRYLSPHLVRYNERIAIDGVEASDESLCAAFAAIEQARGEIPLTYFEFGTLAALKLFRDAGCTVQVLEVGLGGRLDAANIVDADCALITNIGLDHQDWLGPDREAIGREKAGIARANRPAVIAEAEPPAALVETLQGLGARAIRAGRDYAIERGSGDWRWCPLQGPALDALPPPALAGDFQYANAAGVLAAVRALESQAPVTVAAIRAALSGMRLPGRFERRGRHVLDVAHNEEAAQVLADTLRAEPVRGRTLLVLGMLSDKPVEAVCAALATVVDAAWFASLPPPRGLEAEVLAARAAASGLCGRAAGDVEAAVRAAQAAAAAGDRIVICGSFLTVSAAAGLVDE